MKYQTTIITEERWLALYSGWQPYSRRRQACATAKKADTPIEQAPEGKVLTSRTQECGG